MGWRRHADALRSGTNGPDKNIQRFHAELERGCTGAAPPQGRSPEPTLLCRPARRKCGLRLPSRRRYGPELQEGMRRGGELTKDSMFAEVCDRSRTQEIWEEAMFAPRFAVVIGGWATVGLNRLPLSHPGLELGASSLF